MQHISWNMNFTDIISTWGIPVGACVILLIISTASPCALSGTLFHPVEWNWSYTCGVRMDWSLTPGMSKVGLHLLFFSTNCCGIRGVPLSRPLGITNLSSLWNGVVIPWNMLPFFSFYTTIIIICIIYT